MAISKTIAVWVQDLVQDDNFKATVILVPDDDNLSCSSASGWFVWSGGT